MSGIVMTSNLPTQQREYQILSQEQRPKTTPTGAGQAKAGDQ